MTDQTVDFVKWEIQALRDAGSDKPTTINMMYDFQGLNYHKFADVVDFVSWDNYPQWHKKEEYLTAMDNGMQHDIMRSIQKKTIFTDGELSVGNQLAVRKQIKETGNASCSFHAGCCPRIRQYFVFPASTEPGFL